MGLWMFDLAVSQMLQERVPPEHIATVNGVQGAMQNALDMLPYILSIVFSRPADWGVLVFISFAFVALAACCYGRFAVSGAGGSSVAASYRAVGGGDLAAGWTISVVSRASQRGRCCGVCIAHGYCGAALAFTPQRWPTQARTSRRRTSGRLKQAPGNLNILVPSSWAYYYDMLCTHRACCVLLWQ